MKQIKSFREAISTNPDERVIFGYELLSQPDDTLDSRIPGIRKRNDAIITVARERDIVLLSEPISEKYHKWLKINEFSTDNIYVCANGSNSTIPKALVADMNLQEKLRKFKESKIYASRYSSNDEVSAAKVLGAKLFGCTEETTLKFYDKVSFKQICRDNNLPILESTTINLSEEGLGKLEEQIKFYLDNEEEVIIKDPTSSAGANIYVANRKNYKEMLKKISKGNHQELLIEKMVKPIYEINDQWVIGLDGTISHIGASDQIVVNYAHTGNIFPSRSNKVDQALTYSHRIGELMRDEGYIGLFGIDYLEDENNLYISENNSRMNGSTPAWDLVNRLEERHGRIKVAKSYQLRQGTPMSIDNLQKRTKGLIYDGKSQHCFFPLDQGLLEDKGAFTILATGNSYDHVESIIRDTLKRLK